MEDLEVIIDGEESFRMVFYGSGEGASYWKGLTPSGQYVELHLWHREVPQEWTADLPEVQPEEYAKKRAAELMNLLRETPPSEWGSAIARAIDASYQDGYEDGGNSDE